MTISYYSRNLKSPQGWRKPPKKYFVRKTGRTAASPKRAGGSWFNKFKSPKFLLAGFLVFLLFCLAGYFYLTYNLPDPNRLTERQVAQSTKIYDRAGHHSL